MDQNYVSLGFHINVAVGKVTPHSVQGWKGHCYAAMFGQWAQSFREDGGEVDWAVCSFYDAAL